MLRFLKVLFSSLLLLLLNITCKKGDSDFDGKYYFDIKIDGLAFSFEQNYPPAENDPHLVQGVYNEGMFAAASRACIASATTCYGFSLGLFHREPGTYDPDFIRFSVIDNDTTEYRYDPGGEFGNIGVIILRVEVASVEKWGVIMGTFKGTIAKNYHSAQQPELVKIEGRFAVPCIPTN